MTTRRKEGTTPPGREKRGTSPSTVGSGTAAGRRSPGPSPKTNDSGKSIPSYLKPTATSLSSSDASKLQSAVKKKPSPSLTPDKATIERRRSFDKPPSPSRSTKSPASPSPTLRSSSFSGKISNDPGANKIGLARRRSFDKPPSPSRPTRSPVSSSPTSFSSGKTSATLNKGVSERNLKGPKDAGKPHSLYARPASTVKKSSVLTKKSEAGSDSSRKKRVASSPEKVENPDVPEPEQPQSDEQECFAVEEEEPEYNLLEDQDVNNIIEQIEGETHDNDAVIESPTVIEQHDASIESPTAEENQEDKVAPDEPCTDLEHEDEEDKSRDEEMSNEQEDTKEETTNEMNHTDNNDESGAGEGEGEGDPNEEVENKEREEEDDENEETIQVDNGSESNDQLEEKQVEEVVVEEKKEEEEEEDATPRVAHGKKDVALSNDVIEETRNKLIEQRKNRVKALAGAFETVISLQDPK